MMPGKKLSVQTQITIGSHFNKFTQIQTYPFFMDKIHSPSFHLAMSVLLCTVR